MGPGGETEYYRILQKYGEVKHANLLRSKTKSREASKRMWESIKAAEALGVSDADVPDFGPEGPQ